MTNLESILKSRDIIFLTKVYIVKAMDFPEVIYGCESWTIKQPACRRIDGSELWCWRPLTVPWTAKRSNQSILKEISPEYSLGGVMLKLKLQFFVHLMWRADFKKDSDTGNDWKQDEKGIIEDEMIAWHHWLDGHEFEQALGVADGHGSLACCRAWGHIELDTTEGLNSPEVMTERTCWCHAQSHVSELRLSLMLIAHSNQAVYHNTHWWIFTAVAITTALIQMLQRFLTTNDEWSFHAPFYSTALAVEFYFSMTSGIWHVIIKAQWQVEILEFGYESLISYFCLLTCSFFFFLRSMTIFLQTCRL